MHGGELVITSVTLNAAVDKVHYIDGFQLEKVNRVREVKSEPGGKGNNVAKVARLLGSKVISSGFLGGDTGTFVHHELLNRDIASDPVWVSGSTRETFNIIDVANRTQTEILEPGPVISMDEWEAMKVKIAQCAAKSSVVCFSGSLPRGLPEYAYADLITLAKDAGAKTVLDTSGSALSRGIESAPFLCKPNRDELTQWAQVQLETMESVVAAARCMIQRGVQVVVVSLDKDGAIVVTKSSAWHVSPPAVQVVNTVGCGDALVGGVAHKLEAIEGAVSDSQIIEAIAWGTAVAASNALFPIAGHVEPTKAKALFHDVKVTLLA